MTNAEDYAGSATYDLLNPEGEWLLLLLHGLGGDRQQALGLVEGLADPQLAILAPDLRAHGESPIVGPAEAFTFDAMVADLKALIDRLGQGGKPTIVAGISMGAALALRIAIAGTLNVRSLVLVRPAFDNMPNPPNLAVMPVVARLLHHQDREEARRALLNSPEYREIAEVTPSGARSVADQLTRPMARERAIRLGEVPKNVAWHDADQVRSLNLPALVIGADRDVMHPIELARRTAALLPQGRLVAVTPRDVDPERYDREIRAAVRVQIDDTVG